MSRYNNLKISKELMTPSDAQTSGIEQFNTGLTQILQMVQTAAAASEARTDTGVELSSRTAKLKDTVRVFMISSGLSSGLQAHLSNNISSGNA